MFGYVTIYQKDLDNAAMDCYQAYYCGLCQSLGRKYGTAARMALSYDMTFAALLLTALYDPPTQTSQGRCAPHPLRTRPRAVNEFTDYAADMTVVLAYYNYLDDWQDDHKRSRLRLAKQLEPHLENIRRQWPRQCEAIHTKLDELNRLESANSTDLDALCNAFGALLGAVFSPREDFWSPALTQMGRGLGGFIYLMDAYDDLKKDARHGSFNALAATKQAFGSDSAGFEARCHELLTQQMALCAQNFELLPILKDTPEGQLLHNTIYAGVWSKYALVKATRTPRKGTIRTVFLALRRAPMRKPLKKHTAKSASNTTQIYTRTTPPARTSSKMYRPLTVRSCGCVPAAGPVHPAAALPAIMGSAAAAAANSSTRIRLALGSGLTPLALVAPMAGPAAAMTAGNRRRCRPPTTISATGTMQKR